MDDIQLRLFVESMCRVPDMRLMDMQSYRHAEAQACRLTDMQCHRHETHRHADSQTCSSEPVLKQDVHASPATHAQRLTDMLHKTSQGKLCCCRYHTVL